MANGTVKWFNATKGFGFNSDGAQIDAAAGGPASGSIQLVRILLPEAVQLRNDRLNDGFGIDSATEPSAGVLKFDSVAFLLTDAADVGAAGSSTTTSTQTIARISSLAMQVGSISLLTTVARRLSNRVAAARTCSCTSLPSNAPALSSFARATC